MERMISSVFVNTRLKNMIGILNYVRDKNAQDVKDLEVHGLVHVGKDTKTIKLFHRRLSKEKNKTNQ